MLKVWEDFFEEKGAITKDIVIASVHPDLPEPIIDELIESYDPQKHEAPNVIGHPDDNKPAYGWVQSIRKVGRDVVASMNILPEFVDWAKKGFFKKRSISFYYPHASANPTPGKHYLRHVGWLGAAPPQIKGMPDAAFSESGDGIDDNIGFITFSDAPGEKEIKPKEKESMGDKKEEKGGHSFSEEHLNTLITARLAEAEVKWKADHKKEIDTLTEKNTKQTNEIKTLKEDAGKLSKEVHKTQATAEVDKLISEMKLAPKQKDEVVKNLCEARGFSEDLYKGQLDTLKKNSKIITTGEDEDAAAAAKRDLDDKGKGGDKNKTSKEWGHSKEDIEKYGDMDGFETVVQPEKREGRAS